MTQAPPGFFELAAEFSLRGGWQLSCAFVRKGGGASFRVIVLTTFHAVVGRTTGGGGGDFVGVPKTMDLRF